jgi:hypothetical protein
VGAGLIVVVLAGLIWPLGADRLEAAIAGERS